MLPDLGGLSGRDRQPIFPPGAIRNCVLAEGGEAFGDRLWELAVMEGVLDAPRMEYVSDGVRVAQLRG